MFPLVTAFLVTLLAIPLLWKIGYRAGHPSRMGGTAVLAGLITALAGAEGAQIFSTPAAYWVGLSLLFLMGLVDDLLVLSPRTKLLCQIAAVAAFLSLSAPARETHLLHLAFSFLWLLGITNAMNLLDNMDGLCAGVGLILALALLEQTDGSPLPAALAGALAAFLVFNFPPARIYLGDSGSHLVGFTLAALLLERLNPMEPHWFPLLGTVLLFAVPISDTGFVILSRLRRGVPVFQGGKDHLSHHLKRLGWSDRTVALLFYAWAALCVLASRPFLPP